MTKPAETGDKELSAMSAILQALDGLDGASVQRVLDYVFSRLSIPSPSQMTVVSTANPMANAVDMQRPRRLSIRDLKDEKRPESSNQMAALVAFYLSEIAGESDSKDAINSADVEKYFKQAGFKLPKSLGQTLPNAAAAGYFDAVGNGLYRLNPVGYNLVVHGLPRSQKGDATSQSRKKKVEECGLMGPTRLVKDGRGARVIR